MEKDRDVVVIYCHFFPLYLDHIKPNSQAQKMASSVKKLAQICNTASPQVIAGLIKRSHSPFYQVATNIIKILGNDFLQT